MIELLREAPMFSHLTDYQLQNIAAECTMSTFPAGTILFRENETGTVFYIVASGAIKVFTSNLDGENKILSIFTRGDSFGELALLDGQPRSATAQVIEETTLLSLNGKNFNRLLRENIDIAFTIIKQLSTRLRTMNQHVHDLTYLGAKKRVMKALIQLASRHGSRSYKTIRIGVSLNYDELAQLAGVTKPLLFQVFQELQGKQILIFSENEFSIDLAKLKN